MSTCWTCGHNECDCVEKLIEEMYVRKDVIARRIRAMVTLLGDGEMTPTAMRMWERLADEYDTKEKL